MEKITIFEMPSLYRSKMEVTGFRFGSGEKSVAIVGAMRGNEIQQLYICSQLVSRLKSIEVRGGICPGKTVEIIPCINPYSINIEKRFWAMDGTDINRMFPGYDKGETTQRIAAGIFEHLIGWKYGIHFTSFYLRGDFIPHVRMMRTDFTEHEDAEAFALPYVVVRKPSPIDTCTLNYNWQIWNTRAYTILTRGNAQLDIASANMAIDAVLRFLKAQGVITTESTPGVVSSFYNESDFVRVHAAAAGIYRHIARPGDTVLKGDILGEIVNPEEGNIVSTVRSPCSGRLFFVYREPLVMQRQILNLIVKV